MKCKVCGKEIITKIKTETGVTTEVIKESAPAAVRIKIPNTGSNSNYQVTE